MASGSQTDRSQIEHLPVEQLELDPDNPRLPEEMLGAAEPQLLSWLNDEEVLNELASSMLANGFFEHEPVVVLPKNADGKYVVIEGNRRFAAVSILLQLPSAVEAGVNFNFGTPPLDDHRDRLTHIPALVIPDRDAVRKFLGYRHIGGLRAWSPESKARYIEQEIDIAINDGSADPFREVARRVGSTAPAIRGQYIALKILRSAQELYQLNSSYIIKKRFGVWNRLMNSPEVRSYIGFNSPSTVDEINQSIESLDRNGLEQVIGDLTPLREGAKAVLSDSRDVTVYGAALASDRAREALIQYRDLRLAEQIVTRGAIGDRLRSLTTTIDLYVQDIESYDLDSEIESIARSLVGSARTLHLSIKGRVDADD